MFALLRRKRSPAPAERPTPAAIPQELLATVRAIEIRARRLVDNLFLGEYHAVFRGHGIEFDELRPYVPGDDVRAIDWKALARTGHPLIRRYREDRDLTVVFMVDISASQSAGALNQTKADLAAEICAVLALAAIRNHDRVGLLLFGSRPERFVRPASGSSHVLRVIREIIWHPPAKGGTDIGAAIEYLSGIQRRRATIFLVSDFLTQGYARQLRALARRHDVVAIRVREPVDSELPAAGIVRLRDAETGGVVEVDSSNARVRQAYRDHVRAIDEERRYLFGQLGIDEIPVRVGEDYTRALLRFFRRRAEAVA